MRKRTMAKKVALFIALNTIGKKYRLAKWIIAYCFVKRAKDREQAKAKSQSNAKTRTNTQTKDYDKAWNKF